MVCVVVERKRKHGGMKLRGSRLYAEIVSSIPSLSLQFCVLLLPDCSSSVSLQVVPFGCEGSTCSLSVHCSAAAVRGCASLSVCVLLLCRMGVAACGRGGEGDEASNTHRQRARTRTTSDRLSLCHTHAAVRQQHRSTTSALCMETNT